MKFTSVNSDLPLLVISIGSEAGESRLTLLPKEGLRAAPTALQGHVQDRRCLQSSSYTPASLEFAIISTLRFVKAFSIPV